ncbi:hypothetical protein [Flavobacterium sp.]|uniref:hypothetical protein n=1 Tax=Flavobacterium sp. TaxID=239 RepID=UPI00260ECF0D|nr:hypothetical protein [Flavobacterium sp.]
MKRLIFTALFGLMATMSFADGQPVSSSKSTNENAPSNTVCCTRRVTVIDGEGNSNTTIATRCVTSTGDFNIDMGQACANALNAARRMVSLAPL